MYILTVLGYEKEGVYAVETESGEMILYVFTEEDDAVRYAMLLEENDGYPEMHVIELDDELILQTCETGGYKYALITKDDIVFPPKDCPLGTIE